jgi:hypothetical protein
VTAALHCCDRERRARVALPGSGLNGIDWLDVLDSEAPVGTARQRTLLVHLLKPVDAALEALLAGGEAVAIEGGDRQRARALWSAPALAPPAEATAAEVAFLAALPDAGNVVVVRTSTDGDYSRFTLRLRRGDTDMRPPVGFDPVLSEVGFSFKVECPQPFDCLEPVECPVPVEPEPELDYLARDFEPLRRLVVARMRALMPGWTTGSLADLGHVLADILAYAGDQLSYRLDAVGAEAYLATCRTRTALRRHALLVDYRPHEGANARAFVQLELAQGVLAADIPLAGMAFWTAPRAEAGRVPADPAAPRNRALRTRGPLVFEPVDPVGRFAIGGALMPPATVRIDPRHHRMDFHTWGDGRCCLAAGATAATLAGHYPELRVGDVLLFEEVLGPETGVAADADPGHRHAVRLTAVQASDADGPLVDPLPAPVEVTEIEWGPEDALPFALCLSAETAGGVAIENISVAHGNIVLADHGETIAEPFADAVPADWLELPRTRGDRCADDPGPRFRPVRYRPRLGGRPLTHGAVLRDPDTDLAVAFAADAPAARILAPGCPSEPRVALLADGERWEERPDLLLSGAADRHFVIEMETDGSAFLRFGDDFNGARAPAASLFEAHYRVGSGPAGNVGRDSLAVVVTDDARIAGARNPLAATGGRAPETAAQVRRRAPHAFRRQERAVTLADWAAAAGELPGVERAAATTRFTGSWRTTTILVDRTAGEAVTADFATDALSRLERLRIATRDIAIGDPRPVPLALTLLVCVGAGAVRADVEAGLRQVLGSGVLPGGALAHFHPDRLSFGETVYLSPILAAARGVHGVQSVEAPVFARADRPDDPLPRTAGRILLGPTEIARLDSNPDFPERGVLQLDLRGGR